MRPSDCQFCLQPRSVKCVTVARVCDRAICNYGHGLSKKVPKVQYIRQNCIQIISFVAASIGEVRNYRQKQGWLVVSKSLGRTPSTSIHDRWSAIHSPNLGSNATERLSVLVAASIGEVRNCRQTQGGGACGGGSREGCMGSWMGRPSRN